MEQGRTPVTEILVWWEAKTLRNVSGEAISKAKFLDALEQDESIGTGPPKRSKGGNFVH